MTQATIINTIDEIRNLDGILSELSGLNGDDPVGQHIVNELDYIGDFTVTELKHELILDRNQLLSL